MTPNCPECGATKLFKDGLRHVANGDGDRQRWLCRACGFRFTGPSNSYKNSGRR